MFERFTEMSRRVIFFARYEASNYGSRYIGTEHLLLGLLRVDRSLATWFPGGHNEIRFEIESRITKAERFSTAVEVPLSDECSKVLKMAADASERLGRHVVEPVHILMGILQVEESLAAEILTAWGLTLQSLRRHGNQ
jgi:ATP-dependent Clp protease ATP-binding subunit ClpC